MIRLDYDYRLESFDLVLDLEKSWTWREAGSRRDAGIKERMLGSKRDGGVEGV